MYKKESKIYLDTSVISYLQQDDSPEKTAVTNVFWENLRDNNNISVFISDVTLAELKVIMNKELKISRNFNVDDIDKVRERNYENTRRLSVSKQKEYYQKKAALFLSKP